MPRCKAINAVSNNQCSHTEWIRHAPTHLYPSAWWWKKAERWRAGGGVQATFDRQLPLRPAFCWMQRLWSSAWWARFCTVGGQVMRWPTAVPRVFQAGSVGHPTRTSEAGVPRWWSTAYNASNKKKWTVKCLRIMQGQARNNEALQGTFTSQDPPGRVSTEATFYENRPLNNTLIARALHGCRNRDSSTKTSFTTSHVYRTTSPTATVNF